MSVFTDKEIAYLNSQRIGRQATIDGSGTPHNVPVGFHYNPALDTIDIGEGPSAGYHGFSCTARVFIDRQVGAKRCRSRPGSSVVPVWPVIHVERCRRPLAGGRGGKECVRSTQRLARGAAGSPDPELQPREPVTTRP